MLKDEQSEYKIGSTMFDKTAEQLLCISAENFLLLTREEQHAILESICQDVYFFTVTCYKEDTECHLTITKFTHDQDDEITLSEQNVTMSHKESHDVKITTSDKQSPEGKVTTEQEKSSEGKVTTEQEKSPEGKLTIQQEKSPDLKASTPDSSCISGYSPCRPSLKRKLEFQ